MISFRSCYFFNLEEIRLAAYELILSYDIIFRPRTPKGYTYTKKIETLYIVAFFHSFGLFTFACLQCNFAWCLHNVHNIFDSNIVVSGQFLLMKFLKSDKLDQMENV